METFGGPSNIVLDGRGGGEREWGYVAHCTCIRQMAPHPMRPWLNHFSHLLYFAISRSAQCYQTRSTANVRRQVACRYHSRVFAEWRRVHAIVTLLIPPPSDAVVPVDVHIRPSSAGAPGKTSSRAAVAFAVQHDPLPVDMLVGSLYDSQPLYSKCRTDGRWR